MEESATWVQNQGRSIADSAETLMKAGASGSSIPTVLSLSAAAAVTMGLGYYMAAGKPHGKVEPLVDPNDQTVKLPDGSRVSRYVKDGKLMTHLYEDAITLYHGVRRGARQSKNGPMLGHRVKRADGTQPYVWLKYNEVLERADNVAIAFRSLGLAIGQETFIGIYAKNRPEWIITEMATYCYSNVIVPLYETLGADAGIFIVNQADIRLVVCDANSKAMGLLKQKSACPSLSILVVMEEPTDELRKECAAASLRLLTFQQLEELGKNAKERPEHVPPRPSDLATICYTSGTTGTPKGVMLSHGNIIADATTLIYFKNAAIMENDVMISFLPLAHMLERLIEAVCFMVGAKVGFFRGDIRLLAEDIKELRPTVVPVVPRVLNRLYDKVMSEVNKSRLKRVLFDVALAYKTRELNNFIVRNNSWFDQLVFKKIQEGMGGRVKLMITGSAPLAENVLTFVRASMGCIVVEGYGQSECVGACTVSMEGDAIPGHVGMPSPCSAIKLVDVPELGYYAREDAGEVCIRGPNVFQGYFKMPEMTSEVLDADGWLHTGDIGKWTQQGTLKIVDRKKHIFKLSQGEYVAPEKIENIYVRSSLVSQSFVFGESLKTCLIAIVVPDQEVLESTMKERGIEAESFAQLCQLEEVKKAVMEDLRQTGSASGLHSFEQVKDIYLSSEPFSVENDLLTPTLKSKRPQLKKHFSSQLNDMYSRLQ